MGEATGVRRTQLGNVRQRKGQFSPCSTESKGAGSGREGALRGQKDFRAGFLTSVQHNPSSFLLRSLCSLLVFSNTSFWLSSYFTGHL